MVVLSITACGTETLSDEDLTPRPSASITAGSGIEGEVSAGPTCPVEQPGMDCAPRPVTDATVRAVDNAGREAATATTDDAGEYGMRLDPGSYVVSATSPTVFGCDDEQVTIAGGYTKVDISCDTGIR